MWSVEVEYLGLVQGKTGLTKEKAMEIAENAVYNIGAEWSCVYDPDMNVYAQYEM